MTDHASAGRRAPALVRYSNPLARAALRLGAPMGPNVLLTVRGRTSGEPRTAPVAIAEIDGRRYIIAAYGEVHWVRNLRAAREGEVRIKGRTEPVTATELDPAASRAFFGETLPGYIRSLPFLGRGFAKLLFSVAGPEVLNDPDKAAITHPVFELRRP